MTRLEAGDIVHEAGEEWLKDITQEILHEAVKSAIHYGVELALSKVAEQKIDTVSCACLSPVTYDTLLQGYCSHCTRPITLKVGNNGI